MATDEIMELLAEAKSLAKRYYASTGRPLGVTGEIAEYEAVRILGLEVAPVRQSGWDAVEQLADGSTKRFQIKGRALYRGAVGGQRVGALSAKKEWDAVLLVLLDADLEAFEIWECSRESVVPMLLAPGSKARNERGQLGIRQLIGAGVRRWGRKAAVPRPERSRETAQKQGSPSMGIFSRKPVSYTFSRLGFKADVIERLRDSDKFEVVTPVGTFIMSKRDFYRDFANVVRSRSYRNGGLYHYPTVPEKALKYLK